MNRPLVNAFCTSVSANSATRAGSEVEATTKSTGKPPPPGRGGGEIGMILTPGSFASFADASTDSCSEVLVRWLQALVTMPPKPPVGEVIWKMLSASGKEWNTSYILDAKSIVWSRVELADAWMI